MFKYPIQLTAVIISLLLVRFQSAAQQVNEPTNVPAEFSKPFPPFRIAGNLYYVGTYDLACYLITTPKGNILINTGLAASEQMIKVSIEALGFKLTDIKILLTMQAHYDHMGAMAAIKKLTGAKMMVDQGDDGVMEDGGSSDYAISGKGCTYHPVKADRLLHNKDVIKLGHMRITMLHHPGHTKGSCSFLFSVKDEKRKYRILLANMPTIVTDQKFAEITSYPTIAKDYAQTLAAMKNLKFDLWLCAHASQFELHRKYQPSDAYNPTVFVDQKGYDDAISELQKEFNKKTGSVN